MSDMKHGLTKTRPQLSILPRTGLIYGAAAISYGAAKYSRGNYHGSAPEKLGNLADVKRLLGYIDATMRHLTAVSDAINRELGTGCEALADACSIQDDDSSSGFPASGLPHLAHAIASLLIGVSCAADDGLIPLDPGQPWTREVPPEPSALAQKDRTWDSTLECRCGNDHPVCLSCPLRKK